MFKWLSEQEAFVVSRQLMSRSHKRVTSSRLTGLETRGGFNRSCRRRRHSPAALVVEEEDEVEFLFGFVLHLLPDAEHIHGGHGDGHPVVLAAHTRHVGVDDLHTRGEIHTHAHECKYVQGEGGGKSLRQL